MKDYWIHDPDKCEICNGSGSMTRERLDHIMASLQQQGIVKVAGVKDGEPAFTLTATGKNKAEAIIRKLRKYYGLR